MAIKPSFQYLAKYYAWAALDLIYPPVCAGCGNFGKQWCDECASKVQPLAHPLCDLCGDPIRSGVRCQDCIEHPPAFSWLRCYSGFEGGVRKALLRIKYGNDQSLGSALAWDFAQFIDSLDVQAEIVLPVPLSAQRTKQRGYNQVEAIAKPTAELLGIPYRNDLLHRIRDTRSQVGLGVADRRENVRDAFVADPSKLVGRIVLLIDDTTTTGATLDFASRSIINVGAKKVICVAYAKALLDHSE